MDLEENESEGKENRPILDLEDDEPELDDNDLPHNPKKQLNLELNTIDATSEVDHMKVYLRIRPLFEEELHIGEDQNCIRVDGDNTLVAFAPKDSNTYRNAQHQVGRGISQKFTFSKIFNDKVGQKQFFDEAVLGTVKEFISGQNCLVFTYGVTNSGKTYTIQGVQRDVGILPRSLEVIFNSIRDSQWDGCMLKPHMFCEVVRLPSGQEDEEKKMKNALLKQAELEENDIDMTMADSTMSDDSLMRQSILSTTSADSNCDATEIGDVLSSDEKILEDTVTDIDSLDNVRFSIWVSFAEIYNENVHDLLEPATQRRKTTKGRSILTLREDKTGTPYIKGLREIHVTSADEAYKLLTVGKRNLQVACTKLNRNSSRSHCIFTIKMLRVANKENPNAARMSMLSFCDLAGSERYSKTQSLGERIKEAGNINTSLLTLSRCIKILRHNQINKDHPQVVPFRESKLTRLFQSFFCGKGRASMVVNVNPCASTFDETLHVLNYSAIAKQVIVVQESEKSKKGQCIGRQFSLLLEQRCRDTIGWATPGTCAKVFQEEKDLQEEDSESEDEIEEIVSETETEKKLVELVKLLKNQLVQEKQKQLMIEARTREEVCKEVSEQLAQIEAYYGERLEQERVNIEETAEKRLDIYAKSVHRSRKRQRRVDDTENEEAEQTLVQKYEKEIEELRDQLAVVTKQNEQLKEAASMAGKQRDQLQQENTSIKFHMSDLEIKLEKSDTSKLEFSVNHSTSSESNDLASKLAQTEQELEKQKQMVTKLQQVIDMLQCNVADSEDTVQQAKKEANQKMKQMSTLEEELTGKNAKIEELSRELNEKKNKVKEIESLLLQQDKQLEELQNALDQITEELERLQKENNIQDEMLIALRQELQQHREKDQDLDNHDGSNQLQSDLEKDSNCKNIIADLEEDKINLASQVAELKDTAKHFREEADCLKGEQKDSQNLTLQHDAELQKIRLELVSKSNVEEELASVKDELGWLKDDNHRLEVELQAAIDLQKEYEAMDEAKEKELESAFAMQDQLKDELKYSQQATEALETKLKCLEKEVEMAVVENNELKAALEKRSVEIQEGLALREELRMELVELEKGLKEAEHRIKKADSEHTANVDEEVECLHEKLAEGDQRFEVLEESLRSKSEELEECLQSIQNNQSDFERLEEDLKTTKKLLKQNQQQMEDYIVKVNEQVVIIGELTDQLADKGQEKDDLENQLAKLKDQEANQKNELLKLNSELEFQKEHHSREHDRFESKVAESEVQMKRLQEKIKQMTKQELKMKDTAAEMEKRYSMLQVSMEIMNEETTAEHVEHEEVMNQTRIEAQEKIGRIAQLEAELEHLKMLTNGQERDKTETEAEVEQQKEKVNSLIQKLNDAEYKHQMLCRQLRREKGNVEKLLKAAEEDRDALEKQVAELQSELEEVKRGVEEGEKEQENQLEKYKTRAVKLEGVIQDLEMCLKSSKEHEEKALRELDNLRQKCKHLENDCNNKEDTICSLNDELEKIREESVMMANLSNAESIAQMESLRKEVMENKKTIDDLELEIQLKEEKLACERNAQIKLETAECQIKQLKSAKAELENELRDSTDRKLKLTKDLENLKQELNEVKKIYSESEERINDVQNKLIKKESEHEQLGDKMAETEMELSDIKLHYSSIKEQLAEAKCEMNKKTREYDEQVHELEDKLNAKQAAAVCSEQKVADITTKLSKAEEATAGLEHKLIKIQTESSSELKDLQSQLIGKCNELVECHSKLDRQEVQLEESRQMKVELDMKLELLTSRLNEKQLTSSDEVKRLDDKLKITCQQLAESRDRVNKHVQMCSEFEEKCIQLAEEVKELKEKNKLLEESISLKTESELARNSLVTQLENKYKELESTYQDEQCKAKSHLGKLETELEKEQKYMSELKETIRDLREKLNVQAPQVEECTVLKSQIIVLDKKLVTLESAITEAVSMEGKVQSLESELQEQRHLKEKAERTIKSLQDETDDLERRLKQKSDLVNDKFKLQEEVKALHDELNQKQSAARKERKMLEETIETLEEEKKKASMEMEKVLKKVADLEQLEDKYKSELDGLKTSVADTERQLSEAVSRVKTLESELEILKQKQEIREAKLKSRTEALSNFMNKMDEEKDKYKLALEDANANERVIDQLRKTLKEQESVMQDQDTYLKNKEEEIKLLGEELQQKAERCLEFQKKEQDYRKEIKSLQEERKTMEEKIQEMETSLSEQNIKDTQKDELDYLRRAKTRAEEKLAKAKAKQEETAKQLREKVRYEADLKETNQELQKIEKLLKERDDEMKLLRKQYEELKGQQSESNRNIQHEKDTDSYALKILKTKFQAKEELVRQLEQEKLQWKERAKMIQEQKEQELMKWRSERDKLVVQIEKIIKEKEQHIVALQDNGDSPKLLELQKKIEEKEKIIKELNSRAEKTGNRTRRHRSKNTESSSTDDDSEQLKKELALLQRQLDQERHGHKEEVNKILKAKDCVIEDMRQQNYKLTSQLSNEEAALKFQVSSTMASAVTNESSTVPRTRARHSVKQKCADLEQVAVNYNDQYVMASVEQSEQEPVPRIRGKRSRAQKLKSAEREQCYQDEELSSNSKRGNKRERKSTRSVKHHNRSLHLDENNDPSLVIISEDDVIDLDEPASKKSGVSVLANSTNITDLEKSLLCTPKHTGRSLPDPTSSRRKKRLKSIVAEPLALSPIEQAEEPDVMPVHDIVRRKLRSRKK